MGRTAKVPNKDFSNFEMGFVGRDELTGAFKKSYSNFKNIMNNKKDNVRVISYYGLGGIGKSTLLEHIKKDFLDKNKNTKEKTCNKSSSFSDTINFFREDNDEISANNLSVYYDMGKSTERVEIIFSLKNEMINECGFIFPRLDILHRVFNYLRGEDVKISEIQNLIDENASYLKVGVEALGELPLIGALFKIGKTINDVNEIKLKRFKARESLNSFLKEKRKAPIPMEDELQKVFTYELNENLKDLKEPLVIMFDRFEKTMEKTDTPTNPKCKAEWIYYENGLIDSVPKVLWVIAGQKRLTWLDYDQQSWTGILETNEVDELKNNFVVDILRKGNIPDNLIVELAKETGGIPEYIKLCIEHAEYLKARNKKELTIEDFRGNSNRDNKNKFVKRFIENLSEKEHTLMCYLSVFDEWTDDMIEEVMPRVWKNYEDYVYQRVKELPFFESKGNDKFVMKKVIRDIVFTEFIAVDSKRKIKRVDKTLKEIMEYLESNLHVNNSEGEL